MLQDIIGQNFKYTKLTTEEMAKRRILGRLLGPIADYVDPTRNDHLYCEELWENVFQDPIVNEKIDNHCFFGELNHPSDGRTEVDLTKVAICLAEKPKKGEDGKLWGVFDILDTPNGQILKALCDYGCNIGVSSRGEGDIVNGNEIDPETYECECWDAVLLPAVKSARQTLVTESFNKKKISLQESLNRLVKNKDEKESKIMTDTIKSLKETLNSYSQHTDSAVNIKDGKSSTVNNGNELSRTLNENLKLKEQIASLQNELATVNDRVKKSNELLSTYKQQNVNGVKSINEQLLSEKNNNKKLSNDIQTLKEKLEKITSTKNKLAEEYNSMLQVKDKLSEQVKKLEAELAKCKELMAEEKRKYSEELNNLQSEHIAKLEELKTDTAIQQKRTAEKTKKANELAENYRKIAKVAVDNYIQSKAQMLGVDAKEISNKLPANYSFNDINTICESLKSYKTSVSKLPFDVKTAKVTGKTLVKESILPKDFNADDDVDESLLSLANLL